MSYILDALRRAEAQRSRGAVPGLHGPSSAGAHASPARSGNGPGWLVVAVVTLALLLVTTIGLAWWWTGRGPAQPAVPAPLTERPLAMAPAAGDGVPAASGPAPAVPATVLPDAGAQPSPAASAVRRPVAAAPRPAASSAADTDRRSPPPRPAPAPAQSQPQAQPQAQAQTRPQPQPQPRAPATGDGPVGVARPARVEAPPAPAPVALPRRSELPADLQRELPALALGGTVYSADPGQRMVVLNGEVWHEGDRPANGVTVTEVRRKDVVLSYKGQRFILAP